MGYPVTAEHKGAAEAHIESQARDLSRQWEWHEYFRDYAKNQYRTSYLDAIGGAEVACKSEMPSGYGGHCASVRHDILFDNTAFKRLRSDLREDEKRERFPDFTKQLAGLPVCTPHPRGPKMAPQFKTAQLKHGPGMSQTQVEAPWAVTPLEPVPTFRNKVTPINPQQEELPPQELKNQAMFRKYKEGMAALRAEEEQRLQDTFAPGATQETVVLEPEAPQEPAEPAAPGPAVEFAEPAEAKPRQRPYTAPAARRVHTPVKGPQDLPAALGGTRMSRKGCRPYPGSGVAPCVDALEGLGLGVVKRTDIEFDGAQTPRGLGIDLLQRMHASPSYAREYALNDRSRPTTPRRSVSPVTPRACTSPYTPYLPPRPATCEPTHSPREVLPARASTPTEDRRGVKESPLLQKHELPTRCTPSELRAASHTGPGHAHRVQTPRRVVVTSQPTSPRAATPR